jgi:hypothetical protein
MVVDGMIVKEVKQIALDNHHNEIDFVFANFATFSRKV